jgi:hypothetical protein
MLNKYSQNMILLIQRRIIDFAKKKKKKKGYLLASLTTISFWRTVVYGIRYIGITNTLWEFIIPNFTDVFNGW